MQLFGSRHGSLRAITLVVRLSVLPLAGRPSPPVLISLLIMLHLGSGTPSPAEGLLPLDSVNANHKSLAITQVLSAFKGSRPVQKPER